jgi:hypothetical protein
LLQAENANKSASRITSGSICKVRGAYRDPSRLEPSPDVILSALKPPFIITIFDAPSHAEISTGDISITICACFRCLPVVLAREFLPSLQERNLRRALVRIAVSGRIGSACNDEIILWPCYGSQADRGRYARRDSGISRTFPMSQASAGIGDADRFSVMPTKNVAIDARQRGNANKK